VFISGYAHFLRTADSLQWEETTIDLRTDAAAWWGLPEPLRERVSALVAGFCVGEARVADELEPFAAAADREVADCFRAQARDERRHARFFDRVAREVMGVRRGGPEERRAVLRARLEPDFLELFDERLPAASRSLADGAADLPEAVALYHMVLEGVVFLAGQLALLDLIGGRDDLPGLRRGLDLVLLDERWHIGFGARLLNQLPGGAGVEAVTDQARDALDAWGQAVPDHIRETVLHLHRRRLRAARVVEARAAA
jgi:ribonucleoside-diphosphate reductase beta chain